MIEYALRKRLQPVVRRRQHLYLARNLALCWALATAAGLALVAINWLWGWTSLWAVGIVGIATLLATWATVSRSRRFQPDYQAVAREIEQRHPDLKALLLAAVEQKPQGPDGQLGYLQKQVLKEAIVHATSHDWTQSISRARLVLADLVWAVALILLLIVVSQALPPTSLVLRSEKEAFFASGYEITVTPGDTEVESGTSVVVLAQFDRTVPDDAKLWFQTGDDEPRPIPLTKNLDDPVFGGVIPDVTSDRVYHIEYTGQRTRDFTISVYQNPELLQADARIVYPAYTKLPEKAIEDVRRINVVEGSDVTMTFILNKPVTSARLVPRQGIALGLSVDQTYPNVLHASVPTDESQRYELQLLDAKQRGNKVPPRFVVDVHKNLPPEITPVFPNRDIDVSPIEELTLEAKIKDDYGLTDYGLTYALAGGDSHSVTLSRDQDSIAEPQIQYVLALEELDAQPDQLLTYHFWADDLGPDGQPRRSVSDIFFAELRPFEEIFRESESFQDQQNQNQQQNQNGQQGQQAEELVQLQKQIITATWNVKNRADLSDSIDEHLDDVDVIHESQSEALAKARAALAEAEDPQSAQALETAAGHMQTSLDHLGVPELTPALGAEQSAYQELLKLRQREHQIAQSRNAQQSGSASANSARFEQQLRNLELTQEENRYETQRLAQAQQQTAQREDLQVLNRLSELARRQKAMAEKLRETEAALRQAQDEEAKEEALRQLKRLREEQLEALRDMNELEQRMESPENRRRMADSREQLDESRSQVQQSAEELQQGMVSEAINSATRAERQLEETRDDLRRRTSGQFAEDMQNMRQEARRLDQQQEQIAEEIAEQTDQRQRQLSGSNTNRELAEQMDQQRERLETLLDQMRNVSERSETSEPLLSRKLYDTLRNTATDNPDRALETAGELLRRNLLPQARNIERQASKAIDEVREGIEDAAESVLGDEAESLRLAQEQLDEAIRQLNEESSRQGDQQQANAQPNTEQQPQGGRRPGQEPQGDQPPREGQQQPGQQRQGGQPADGEPRQLAEGQQPGQGQPQASPPQEQRDREGQRRIARDTEGQERTGGPGGGEALRQDWNDSAPRGPLTGQDYRQWSDRLRDVEEMLSERELREEVARVRDRAKAFRGDFMRHGQEPQWDLVQAQIMEPLSELRKLIDEKLAQLKSDEALVPIDRDPVPDRFADVVEKYFENLGGQR